MVPTVKPSTIRFALAGLALLVPPLSIGSGLSWRHGTALAQTPEPTAVTSEKEAFEAAKDLGTSDAWGAFLSNYPTGFRADLARAYVKKLSGTQPPPSAAVPAQGVVSAEPAYELPCTDATKLKSERSNEPAKIRFVNESEATLIIQWIDFNGSLKEYGELKPGAELTQDTFITHPWIAAYQEGSCRQMFLPGNGLSIARLRPENQLPRATGSKKLSKRGQTVDDESDDHGPTPEQTCRDIGEDYDGSQCVKRKTSKKTSKATINRRAKAACVEIGMIYLNGQCAPKTKAERKTAQKKKNKACPAGMYRNPYGQCQPNETGG